MASESLAAVSQFFSTAHGAGTLFLAIASAALGLIAAACKFRHEQFRKLPLEHLKMLQEAAGGDPLITRCVTQAAHLEVARQTFGIALNPAAADYLFRLMDHRRFSLNTLRAAAPYVQTDGPTPTIQPGYIGRLLLASTAALALLTVWVTIWLMWTAFQIETPGGTVVMLGIEIVGLLVAGLIARVSINEGRAFYCAREAAKLTEGETPICGKNPSAPLIVENSPVPPVGEGSHPPALSSHAVALGSSSSFTAS